MTDIPIEQLSFIPTGGSSPRGLGDWSSDHCLNVKNFGALGNAVADDSAAIQACFDAAFGTAGSPHGTNSTQNKAVFFPPGNYKAKNLLLTQVVGARIFGSGAGTTSLSYSGSIGSTGTLITVNGMTNSRIENLRINGVGAVNSPNTIGIDLDWNGSGSVGLSGNTIQNIFFGSIALGIRIGNSGNEGHANQFLACHCTTVGTGFKIVSPVAYSQLFIGGGVVDHQSGPGHWFAGGSGALVDVSNAGSVANPSILMESPATVVVTGGRSEETEYAKVTNGKLLIIGVDHEASSTAGPIVEVVSPGVAIIDGCKSTKGWVTGNGTVYVRGDSGFCTVTPGNPFQSFTGQLREWMTRPLTFALVPGAADGCEVDITDAHSATGAWGETVSGAGGTTIGSALMRYNGTNWTLVSK